MNKEQENYISMSSTVDVTCVEEAVIVATVPALQLCHSDLTAKIGVVKAFQRIQETSIRGWASKKDEMKTDMIKKTIKLVNGVSAYALDKEDTVLFDEVNYTESRLKSMRDEEVDAACEVVAAKTAAILIADLAPFGIVAADKIAQNAATGLYIAVKQMPSEKEDEVQVATKGIEDSIGEIRKIFVKMDRLAKTLKETEPGFVEKYFNSREIYDIGVRHKKDEPPVPPTP